MIIDKKFRKPRIWSNAELRKISKYFTGKVVNVSGWRDEDKEGSHYVDYFNSAQEYWISNYKSSSRGFQGNLHNEFYLDLSEPLNPALISKYDVVFNHTVLEHVFDLNLAFSNLCALSKDIVILVVPFIQEQHSVYGDYWRFTPQAVDLLFKSNNMKTIYLNYNDLSNESIYIFCVGSKEPIKWEFLISDLDNKISCLNSNNIGTRIIKNNFLCKILSKIKQIKKKI